MKNFLFRILLAASLFAFVSCSSDSNDPYDGGHVKLSVTGNLGTSRADKTTWGNYDEIGVTADAAKSGSRFNVKYCTPSGDGNFSYVEANPIIFGDGEELSLTAYYPHTTSIKDGIIEFTKPEAFLYAPEVKASHTNPTANFIFSHRMAKITFIITDNSGLDAGLPFDGEITMAGVTTSGSFNILTGVVTPSETTGALTDKFPKSGIISFIVAPSAEARQVTASISYADRKYSASTEFPRLESGKNYNFNVKIPYPLGDKNLTITASNITEWVDTTGGNINMVQDDEGGNNNGSDNDNSAAPAIGNFLLADGTILSKDADVAGKDIAGVIFYVGNPQPSVLYSADCSEALDALRTDAPEAVRGLAVALKNANPEDDNPEDATMGFLNDNDLKSIRTSYKSAPVFTADMVMTSFSTLPSKISGYSYTKYIEDWRNTTTFPSVIVRGLFTALNTFRDNNKVQKASSWYIPSYPELVQIYNNLEVINSSLEKAGTQILPMKEEDSPTFSPCYFSSNMMIGGSSDSSPIGLFTHTMNPEFLQNYSDPRVPGWLRPVIAF